MKLIIYFPKQIVQKSWAQTRLYKQTETFFLFAFFVKFRTHARGGRDFCYYIFLTSPERKSLQYPSVSMKRFLFERNLVPGIWKENRKMGKLHCQTPHWTLVHYFWNNNQGLEVGWQVWFLNHFLRWFDYMTCMIASCRFLCCQKNHCLLFFDSVATWGCIASAFPSSVQVSTCPTIFYTVLDVFCWSLQNVLLHLFSFFLSISWHKLEVKIDILPWHTI